MTRADAEEVCQLSISIRTPAWGVTGWAKQVQRQSDFNSHPRVGGDLCSAAGVGNSSNFNSHPRVGGDLSHNCRLRGLPISIRTPAWGVTRILEYIGIRKMISIRTPAWGVTMCGNVKTVSPIFQFAPPRGG